MHTNSYIILQHAFFPPRTSFIFHAGCRQTPRAAPFWQIQEMCKSKVRSDASQQIFHYRDKVHKALIASALAWPNTQYNRLWSLRSIHSCHTDIYPRENCNTPHHITSHLWHKFSPKETWVMYIWRADRHPHRVDGQMTPVQRHSVGCLICRIGIDDFKVHEMRSSLGL